MSDRSKDVPPLFWESGLEIKPVYSADDLAASGGGLAIAGSYPSLSTSADLLRCRFVGNTARKDGGALWSTNGDTRVRDTLFSRNRADSYGGAVSHDTTLSNFQLD